MNSSMIEESASFIRARIGTTPLVGIVLGTGLHAFTDLIEDKLEIDYKEIPHFPQTTVSFHSGKLIFGRSGGKDVVAMQGRLHYYEGYSMQQITFPIRVLHALGISHLILSNAAGGINLSFRKGDLIVIEDHLNFMPDNPLRGIGNEFGNIFVDLSRPYSLSISTLLRQIFNETGLEYKSGVYAAVMGPNLETRAEYRWLANAGADMVGMSTVPEVIVGNQLGLLCAAISVITDECDPDNLQPVDIPEIIAVAARADGILSNILSKLILSL
jgi:purine-nucleoside phosphorylase